MVMSLPLGGSSDPARRWKLWPVLLAVVAGLGGCIRAPRPLPFPNLPKLALLPVDNRTGGDLHADATPLIGLLRGSAYEPRVTAASLLTDELQRALVARGVEVITLPAIDGSTTAHDTARVARELDTRGLDAPALFVQLWKWEPLTGSHVLYVDVELDAFLVARDGRVLWAGRFPAHPVDGGGASSVALAYPAVARQVAAETLGRLAP